MIILSNYLHFSTKHIMAIFYYISADIQRIIFDRNHTNEKKKMTKARGYTSRHG